MLKKIIMKNISSIKECIIDFKKKSYKFLNDNINNGYVNPIGIYGHNGSGKTSFFKGITTLINLFNASVDNLYPFIVNHFLFLDYQKNKKKNPRNIEASINLFFEVNQNEYEYFIETSVTESITKEYLKHNGNLVFERELSSLVYKSESKEVTFASLIPALRFLAQKEITDQRIQEAFTFISSFSFADLTKMGLSGGFITSKYFYNQNSLDLTVNKGLEIKELLREYDEFPIFSIIKKGNDSNSENKLSNYFIKYENVEGEIPISFISDGMLSQSVLLSLILSLPKDSVLFIDEMSRALHPSALSSFIKIVKKKNIQLVFSSHNTVEMQELRPDQIYFAKWDQGFSKYYRLSDIYPAIREVNNIEKMYLSGTFDEEMK